MNFQLPKPFLYSDGVIRDNQGTPVLEVRTDNSYSSNELEIIAKAALSGMNLDCHPPVDIGMVPECLREHLILE